MPTFLLRLRSIIMHIECGRGTLDFKCEAARRNRFAANACYIGYGLRALAAILLVPRI